MANARLRDGLPPRARPTRAGSSARSGRGVRPGTGRGRAGRHDGAAVARPGSARSFAGTTPAGAGGTGARELGKTGGSDRPSSRRGRGSGGQGGAAQRRPRARRGPAVSPPPLAGRPWGGERERGGSGEAARRSRACEAAVGPGAVRRPVPSGGSAAAVPGAGGGEAGERGAEGGGGAPRPPPARPVAGPPGDSGCARRGLVTLSGIPLNELSCFHYFFLADTLFARWRYLRCLFSAVLASGTCLARTARWALCVGLLE